jgi:hypothetical protein
VIKPAPPQYVDSKALAPADKVPSLAVTTNYPTEL